MNEHIYSRTGVTGDAFQQGSKRVELRGFVRRQFEPETTLAQLIFDITIGIVAPVLCLAFDPIVFRSEGFGSPLFSRYQFFAYSVIVIEIAALAVWLAFGSRAGEWCGVLGGMMLAGAFFSAIIGIILLPFSLIGLMFLIGVFGFTPFLTTFIYLRNARRALKEARAQMMRASYLTTLILGATLALGVPLFAHWRVVKLVERSVAEVLGGDDAQAQVAARRLRHVRWFAPGEIDQMAWAYGRETGASRRARLARAYHEITDTDIESRLSVLND